MSLWTHVTGAIRFDCVAVINNNNDKKNRLCLRLKKMLGNTCQFNSSNEDWIACTVPCGSEGSLQYNIYEYGGGLPWVIVAIWGDLRDYGNDEEIECIKNWFNNVCKEWVFIRQGILEVCVEGKDPVVLQYKVEKEE